jgi:hypothetical protein
MVKKPWASYMAMFKKWLSKNEAAAALSAEQSANRNG